MGTAKDSLVMYAAPIGSVTFFAGPEAPDGWLECDGAEYYREDFPELFKAIGTTHGEGDGELTFNVPDAGGRILSGRGKHAAVEDVGANDGLASELRVPGHAHKIASHTHNLGNHTHDINLKPQLVPVKAEVVNHPLKADAFAVKKDTAPFSTSHSSTNAAGHAALITDETTTPFLVLMTIIKY